MNIGVKLTQDDYIAFNIHHALHSKQGRRSLMFGRLMMAFVSVVTIVVWAVTNVAMLLLAAASIAWYFLYPLYTRWFVRRQVRRVAKYGKLPFPEEAELDFGENEVVETTPTSVQKTAYADVMELHDSADYIFVYVGAIQAIIIPKHCIEGREDELKTLLMEKCPRLK